MGDDVGGSHISALGLIRALDPSRFRPLVLVQQDAAIAALFRDGGIRSLIAPPSPSLRHGERVGPGALVALVRAYRSSSRFLKSKGVDIVHTNDGRTHAAWAVPAKLAGAKLVWHHRGSPDALGRRFLAPLLADQIISVSEFAATPRKPSISARRNVVIHSPFDVDLTVDRVAAREMLVRELDCDPRTRIVGFSGAFTARKRPLLFVDAIARAKTLAPERALKGVMFGSPFDVSEAMVRARAQELGVDGSVHLMGFRSPGSAWLAACDALMVPAIDEPFGRTLIEAMLVGTPVIATRSGGNAEALRDGQLGLLVPPEDPGALGAAVDRLFANQAFAQSIVREARTDARSRFGIRQHCDAVMALYERQLETTRPARQAQRHGPSFGIKPKRQ
jgi:glycosyltransferase involved in cell wall biosynthesis